MSTPHSPRHAVRRLWLTVVVALTTLVTSPIEAQAPGPVWAFYLGDVRVQAGDDPRWASPDWDDSQWAESKLWEVGGGDGIYWLRTRFTLEEGRLPADEPVGVLFSGLATVEVFWDGEPLATNGRVGSSPEDERPGPISQVIHVPDRLATYGEHVIAVRLSHHHRGFDPRTGLWEQTVGAYGYLSGAGDGLAWMSMMSLSGLLVAGVYFLVLFVLDRRERAHLLLGLLCAAAAALLVAEAYRNLFGYTYDWHIARLRAVTALSYIVNLLLVGFLVTRFPLPGRRVVLWSAALLFIVPIFIHQGWDPKAAFMFLIGFTLAFGWSVYAVWRRQPGSVFVLGGVLVCFGILLVSPFRFLDLTFFLSLDLMLMALLIAHAVQVRKTRHERELANLRSARLEAELLRRHIQPHFLMNSLTALSDWVEQDPKVAARLIQALAEEFRALSAVAHRTLVPLRDEVRLCRSHLEVMALRRGCDYRLKTEHLDEDVAVPPAVFHTLVENAITHNPQRTTMELKLSQQRHGDRMRFVFDAPLGERGPAHAEPAGEAGDAGAQEGEGTGLRYIRARLSEAFGSSWQLSSGTANGIYRTEIVLPFGA